MKKATNQSERAATHNRNNALTRYREWKTFETLELAQRVAALYLQGKSIKQIAEKTGRQYDKIKYCLTKVREIWTKAAAGDYEQHIANELARIFTVETEAWGAWHQSKRDSQSVTEVDSEHPMTTKTRSRSNGDPRFLAIVQKCSDQRTKLLGLGISPDDQTANRPNQILEVVIHNHSEKGEFERIMDYSQFKLHQQSTDTKTETTFP
jgi:hypothetical protein